MSTDATDKTAQLRERLEQLRMEREAAQLESVVKGLQLSNSQVLMEGTAWNERVPLSEYPAFDQWAGGRGFDRNIRGDRDHGRDRPYIETEQDLEFYRGLGRRIGNEVPSGIAVLNTLRNYVIGTNWGYEAAKRQNSEPPDELVEEVQEFIDDWLSLNDWIGDRDQETLKRAVRDGESPISLTECEDGFSHARFVEPSHVTEPANSNALAKWLGLHPEHEWDWKFGVLTKDKQHEDHVGYHVVYDQTGRDFDFFPIEPAVLIPGGPQQCMQFIKVATDRNVKRGITEFWPVRNHLKEGEKVFHNTSVGSAIQAAIAWVEQFREGTKKSDIEALAGNYDTYNAPKGSGGTETRNIDRYKPGTVRRVEKGREYKPGPLGSQRNPNFILAGQAVLRLAGVRWSMTEWMISGDASNNNLASSIVAESPFVKEAETEQEFFRKHFYKLLWKALKIAFNAGRFARWGLSWREFTRLIEINIVPAPVATRDKLKQAQINQIESDAGVLSRRTWATESGRDFNAEQDNMEEERRNNPQPTQPTLESVEDLWRGYP